jgi:glutaredoxin domain-containing cysteine-rich protein 1
MPGSGREAPAASWSVDEHDVSMDASLRCEVQALLTTQGRGFSLPQLLVGGRLVRGGDEVCRLHEAGELRRVLEGASGQDPAFMPCPGRDRSRKVFVEAEG